MPWLPSSVSRPSSVIISQKLSKKDT